MTRISVVVPARNEEERLPRCLAALRCQSLSDFELIIVVDSASTDRTGEVARDSGARVVRVEEPGVARARQAGFEVAQGEIIVSTDADAIPSSDWLERLVAPFCDPGVVGTFGTLHFTRGGLLAEVGHALFSVFQRANYHSGRPLFCGPNFAVSKGAFHRLALKIRKMGKIVFLHDLPMVVSVRNLEKGRALRYTIHHIGVYLKVCWLERLTRKKE
jgi:glycosyltransferase involved in cell wall biosynthesis